jgi:hypothetical protein
MSEPRDQRPTVLRVPGRDGDHDVDEGLTSPADIGSASRSCLAIIIMLLVIALLVCLFLLLQPIIN